MFVNKNHELTSKQVGMCQTLAFEASKPNHDVFGAQNMAFHVQDDAKKVHQNRLQLLQQLQPLGVKHIQWLTQVHSTDVVHVHKTVQADTLNADAMITQEKGVALAIMTADCLPILLVSEADDPANNTIEVAAIHAGWRGLAGGIIEKTIQQMQYPPNMAWIGAAIHQPAFEVGQDVYDAFCHQNFVRYTPSLKDVAACFQSCHSSKPNNTKYLANLPLLAKLCLQKHGIKTTIHDECSFAHPHLYSYRRAHQTGRMASLVWIK